MYYSLRFPCAEQYKTIHYEYTIKHLFPEQRTEELYKILRVHYVESCGAKIYVKALYHAWYNKRFVGAKALFPYWEIHTHTHSCVLLDIEAGTKRGYLTDFLPSQFLTQGHLIGESHSEIEAHAWLNFKKNKYINKMLISTFYFQMPQVLSNKLNPVKQV